MTVLLVLIRTFNRPAHYNQYTMPRLAHTVVRAGNEGTFKLESTKAGALTFCLRANDYIKRLTAISYVNN